MTWFGVTFYDKRSPIRCLPSSVQFHPVHVPVLFTAGYMYNQQLAKSQHLCSPNSSWRITVCSIEFQVTLWIIWNAQIMKCQKWSSAKVRLNIYRTESREHQLCQNKSKIERTTFTCQVFKFSDIRSNLKHNRIDVLCLVRKIDVNEKYVNINLLGVWHE